MTKRVLALAGPTGSGKTDWSLKLAAKINGVIIAADSRTVYRGLDIGTGKVTTEYPATWHTTESGPMAVVEGIEHYGLNLVEPTEQYTAPDWQSYVYDLLPTLWERGKLPMLVGGTGLYIDAVLRGFVFPASSTVPPDWTALSTHELFTKLTTVDPVTASRIDTSNRSRVERALAYAEQTGKQLAVHQAAQQPDFESLLCVIDLSRQELYARIDARIERWITAGLFAEVEGLRTRGVPADRIKRFGQVYRAAFRVVSKETSLDDFRRTLAQELHTYARKQLTWWRRHDDVSWVSEYTELEANVRSWLGMS